MRSVLTIFLSVFIFSSAKTFSAETRALLILESSTSHFELPSSLAHYPVLQRSNSELAKSVESALLSSMGQFILRIDSLASHYERAPEACEALFDNTTILYISSEDGGYARRGFWFLEHEGHEPVFCDLLYVDMTVSQTDLENGSFLEIFSHEMGHVFLRRMHGDLEHAPSSRFHNVFALTDYQTAFDEGFGIYFQTLAAVLNEQEGFQQRLQGRSNPSLADQWFSRIDGRYRIFGVMHNQFIFARLTPQNLPTEEAYLMEGMTPAYSTHLLNGQSMMASEGVIATLFYRLATDPDIGNVSSLADTNAVRHHEFLLQWLSDVDLSSTTVPPFIQTLNNLRVQNPELTLASANSFLHTTLGTTVDPELRLKIQELIHSGHRGDLSGFLSHYAGTTQALHELASLWQRNEISLDAALGLPLWILHPDVKIPVAPWSPEQTSLTVNLNTASILELIRLDVVDEQIAKEILLEREENGYFRDINEFLERVSLSEQEQRQIRHMHEQHQDSRGFKRL